jgi:hypothetical protein
MASFTFAAVDDTWPPGTVVGAYRWGSQVASFNPAVDPPSGAPVVSAVAVGGPIEFTGLADDTSYVAGGITRGRWRFRQFRTPPLSASGQLLVVRWANGIWPRRPETSLPIVWAGPSQPTTGMRAGDLFIPAH